MALINDSGVELCELRVDGGPVNNNFLMQFQSDMLQAKINRSPVEEASALGAVLMNGFALKRLVEFSDAATLRTKNDYIEPKMAQEKIDSLYSEWSKAVQRTLMK
jgi:glycerol kinase